MSGEDDRDRGARLPRDRREQAGVLLERVDRPDDSAVAVGESVTDLVDGPQIDRGAVERGGEPLVEPGVLPEPVQEDDRGLINIS